MFEYRGGMVVMTLLLACASAGANGAEPVDDSTPIGLQSERLKPSPPLPSPNLAVPDDSRLAFSYEAVGVQIYVCQATTSGYAWTFQAPEAKLTDPHGRVVVKHYAGPTWESVSDHSKVVAKKVAEFSAHADAIPELLLQVTAHDGKGTMADVSYIQRLATKGGLPPTADCDSGHIGATARADYTATYAFSRPRNHRK